MELSQKLEFQLASINTGIATTRSQLDEKGGNIQAMDERLKRADELHGRLHEAETRHYKLESAVSSMPMQGGGGGWSFWFLFFMILALAGVGCGAGMAPGAGA